MVRGAPGRRDKLAQAARALYSERGYERTTVAEIAKQAGLTERTFFRPFAHKRQAVIMANAELQERELIKLAALSAALSGALRRRGVAEPAASLTAEAGLAVFKIGFERWVARVIAT